VELIGRPGAAQRLQPARLPLGVPAADVLPGDAKGAGDLGLGAASGKQRASLHADSFKRLAVTQAAGVAAVGGRSHAAMLPGRPDRMSSERAKLFRACCLGVDQLGGKDGQVALDTHHPDPAAGRLLPADPSAGCSNTRVIGAMRNRPASSSSSAVGGDQVVAEGGDHLGTGECGRLCGQPLWAGEPVEDPSDHRRISGRLG
jgi:hypothetical protein